MADGCGQLWDLRAPDKAAVRTLPSFAADTRVSARLGAGGCTAMSGSRRALKLWDIRTGRCRADLSRDLQGDGYLQFCMDPHATVAVNIVLGRPNLHVWDLSRGVLSSCYDGHDDDDALVSMDNLCSSPDLSLVAAVGSCPGPESDLHYGHVKHINAWAL